MITILIIYHQNYEQKINNNNQTTNFKKLRYNYKLRISSFIQTDLLY